jgi:hypothetical protein
LLCSLLGITFLLASVSPTMARYGTRDGNEGMVAFGHEAIETARDRLRCSTQACMDMKEYDGTTMNKRSVFEHGCSQRH